MAKFQLAQGSRLLALGTRQLRRFTLCITLIQLGLLHAAYAENPQAVATDLPSDLTEIGLKRLLDFDLVVTSPGKKEQPVSNVASAIFVLTNDDIKRSGATHIADVLRLVPGVNVARVSSSKWAVSVRGFNQVFANKLLVLIDGVSVFSTVTNGVYWETIDPDLNDIDRIEVIRGPGAALWGANAVNGVINILSKKAKDTQGNVVSAGLGTHTRALGSVRSGTKVSDSTYARISAKVTDFGSNRLSGGGDGGDDSQIGSVDGRIDTAIDESSSLSLIGHGFAENYEEQPTFPSLSPPFTDTTSYKGAGRWRGAYTGAHYREDFSSTSSLDILGSVLYQELNTPFIEVGNTTYELDGTHRFSPIAGQDIVYGGALRLFDNSTQGTFAEDTIPSHRDMYRSNLFFQDEISVIPNELSFIVGSKFEVNSSTGFEYMPNARIVDKLDEKNTIWAAVSRAVAPPALVFEDLKLSVATIPGTPPNPNTLIQLTGDRSVDSEDLLAYEVGYRSEIEKSVTIDVALFYNRYNDVLTQEASTPFFGTPNRSDQQAVIVPLQFGNGVAVDTIGGELSLDWRATDWLRLVSGYTVIKINARSEPGSADENNILLAEGSTPEHQVLFRALVDMPFDTDLSVSSRYVTRLSQGDVPGYVDVDARLGWKICKDLELSLVGQNLANAAHQEFTANLLGPPAIELERAYYGKFTWSF